MGALVVGEAIHVCGQGLLYEKTPCAFLSICYEPETALKKFKPLFKNIFFFHNRKGRMGGLGSRAPVPASLVAMPSIISSL